MTLREDFLAFDDRLASHGVPPLTAWWRAGIGDWLDRYEREHVLEFWACVGRGAAKSTALYKLAAFFALFGDFEIPPGERHFAVVISRLKEEASKGISIIDRWLDLLGVAHKLTGDVIELERGRGIRIMAASVAAASGPRAFLIIRDERSKWAMGGAEMLDAQEVDTSATAMTATHPLAPTITAGSAWGSFGEFYETVTAGTTDARHVVGPAATWVAAPHIREEDLRRKERDPRKFAREYACTFQAAVSAAFDPDDVRAAFAQRDASRFELLGTPLLVLDPTAGRSDRYTWCLAGWIRDVPDPRDMFVWEDVQHPDTGAKFRRRVANGYGAPVLNPDYTGPSEPKLAFWKADGMRGRFGPTLLASELIEGLATTARALGVRHVVSDQFEKYMLESEFRRYGLGFTALDQTNKLKTECFLHANRLLKERRIVFEPHEQFQKDMLGVEERILPSGAMTYGSRRTAEGHGDFASLVFTMAAADLEGLSRGGPIHLPKGGARRTTGAGDFT